MTRPANKVFTPVDRKDLDSLLAALEPTRMSILLLVGKHERMCVCDIARHFRMTRPAISHHLKVLKVSGLLESEREGQQIYYYMSKARLIANLRRLLDQFEQCC